MVSLYHPPISVPHPVRFLLRQSINYQVTKILHRWSKRNVMDSNKCNLGLRSESENFLGGRLNAAETICLHDGYSKVCYLLEFLTSACVRNIYENSF